MSTAAQISPKSNLPPAARRQVEAANELIAQLNAKPGEIPAGTEYQVAPGSEAPGTLPTGQNQRWTPASQAGPPAQQPGTQPVEQHTSSAGAPPPPPPPPPSDTTPPSVDAAAAAWEQRYRTLQGKYDAETRMTREILQSQQHTMDELIKQRGSTVAPTAPAVQQTPEEYLRSLGITEKEISDYGELLPIVARLAQNMIRPTAAALEAELANTKRSAGQVSAALMQDRKTALFTALDNHPVIGNVWRVMNDATDFLAWLDQLDILSGTSRRNLMTDAFQKLDSARVAAIFERFIQEDSASRSTLTPSVDVNTLIAPGSPRGGAAEAPGGAQHGKRILSEKEIRDFYTRVRKKQVSPEAYLAFSAEIASATAEGRIRPDQRNIATNG